MNNSDTPQPETLGAEQPFTAFGQFGAGNLDLRVFDQTRWWVDINGSPHRITTMSEAYLVNVIEHCQQHAAYYYAAHLRCSALAFLEAVLEGSLTHALGIALAAVDTDFSEPIEWVRSTPLFGRLSAELRTRLNPAGPNPS
jgi:hypothetical protein